MECLHAPSRIGRRAAMHGLFHVVEWVPEMKDRVVAALRASAREDDEPLLRAYAADMAEDIETDELDHAADPVFPEEK